MWFVLSLLALSMLVARRSAEKHVAGKISSLGMTWIQQAVALPFILATLFFTKFYWPSELSGNFWALMVLFVVLISFDFFCYFKALSIADISYVAPLLSMVAIGSLVGNYFILDQIPSVNGVLGALLIVVGAFVTYSAKKSDVANRRANKLALILVLLIVVERGIVASIDVLMLRESNPTSFNFYSSLLTIPFVLLVSFAVLATDKKGKYQNYWQDLGKSVSSHKLLLAFIGATYTINMLATYQAKLLSTNAGYVTSIKAASVLPIMLVGWLVFKEKITNVQWLGLAVILAGLILLAFN